MSTHTVRPLLISLLAVASACQTPSRAEPGPGAAARDTTTPSTTLTSAPATSAAPPASVAPERYRVPLSPSGFRGSDSARVTIVVFTDYQCPFCMRGEETLAELLRAYPGQLRVQLRHHPLPIHQNARLAAMAVLAAGAQGRAWEMHDLLFHSQSHLERADLTQAAAKLGLDGAAFTAALDAPATAAAVAADMALGRRLGVRGTPTFFINGRLLRGAQPIDAFRRVIDEELAAPAQSYEALIANGLDEAKGEPQEGASGCARPEGCGCQGCGQDSAHQGSGGQGCAGQGCDPSHCMHAPAPAVE
ncbi:MAG TPA: DsbA family protein [Polyangia bacterium]|nr:DsbA family protein [Polyangia bacterium]